VSTVQSPVSPASLAKLTYLLILIHILFFTTISLVLDNACSLSMPVFSVGGFGFFFHFTPFLLFSSLPRLFQFSTQFLADRTNGRAYATVLRLSVCHPSVVRL